MGVIAGFQYEPGNFVSTDQFVVAHPRHLFKSYGKEAPDNSCHGGTNFVEDAASSALYAVPQVSLGTNDTVLAKPLFEEWLFHLSVCEVKHYHYDNSVFTADKFCSDVRVKTRCSPCLELARNIRMLAPSVLFK